MIFIIFILLGRKLLPIPLTVDDGTEITEKSVDGYCCLKRDGEEHLLTVYFLVDESELEDCYMQVSPSSSMAGYYEYMTIYLGEGE